MSDLNMNYSQLLQRGFDYINDYVQDEVKAGRAIDEDRILIDAFAVLEYEIDINASEIFFNNSDLLNSSLCELEIQITDDLTIRQIAVQTIANSLHVDFTIFLENILDTIDSE